VFVTLSRREENVPAAGIRSLIILYAARRMFTISIQLSRLFSTLDSVELCVS
jgi:hypothetical protein